MDTTGFLEVQPVDLVKRCISEEICRKFGYGTATDHNGKTVQVANYRDEHGRVVAQKVRTSNKKFSIIGAAKEMKLFGQHLWKAGGRRCVVTEGEIDALSVAAATGGTWPVVSLPNGAQSAKKAIMNSLEWLESFEQVVLAYDMDDPGRAAAAECVELFSPGKVAVAELTAKDANAMLVAGNVKELSQLLWQARVWRPDGIVSLQDIRERVMKEPTIGFPYPWAGVTEDTYGRRLGDLIGIGGGSGCGKTDFMTSMIAHDVTELGLTVGVIYLETPIAEVGKRIAGKVAGKPFHLPGGGTREELEGALDRIPAARLCLYDSFGSMDFETIESRMRYMAVSLGCRSLYLDHLTALAAAEDDERKALEGIMAKLSALAQSLKIMIHFVSHLATPEGRPHEEGGRVAMRHFKGSRAIGFWSHTMWGLERDTQQPGTPTTLRCLKDRFTGRATGKLFGLQYDQQTSLLHECALTTDEGYGFNDETGNGEELPF